MSQEMIAVSVGYYFSIVPKKAVKNISLRPAGRVKKDETFWTLHVGETFDDSRRVDEIMSVYGEEFCIKDYAV